MSINTNESKPHLRAWVSCIVLLSVLQQGARLGGTQIEDFKETEFDRLFAVVLSNGKHVRTLELHYE